MFNPLAPNNTRTSYSYDVQGNRNDAGQFLGPLLNMVRYTPGEGPGTQTMVYDLWGRLMSTSDSATGSTTNYSYDALGRLARSAAVLKVYDEEEDEDEETPSNDLLSSTVRWMTYDASGRVIHEEIEAANTGHNLGFGTIYQQRQVWSPTTGGLIFRERYTDDTEPGDEERLYAMYDGAGNVTAITDKTGQVVERYATDPFGGDARVFDAAGQQIEKLTFTPNDEAPGGGTENPNPFEGYGNGAAIIAQTTLGTTHDWDTLSSNLGKSDGVTGMYLGTGAVYNPSFNSIATDSGSGGLSFNAITGYVGSSPTAKPSADDGGGWSWGSIYSAIAGAYNWYTSSNFITNGQRAMWLGNQMKSLSGWAVDYASNSNNIFSATFGATLAYGADFAGSTAHSVGGILRAVEDPLGTAMGIYGQYQSYNAMGIGAWDASVLMFNPLTGVAEAWDGVSYQAGEFGRGLDGLERFERGTVGVLNTAGTALGGVASLRGVVNGSVYKPVTNAQAVQGLRAVGKRLLGVRSATSTATGASAPVGRRGYPIDIADGTNAPGQVGGRSYGGHAFDQMQGRGVPPSAVENAIRTGRATPDPIPGRIRYDDVVNGLRVVTEADGTVVTVITRGR